MRHAGILNQVCKICKKGYSTKNGLTCHIIQQHFSKISCDVPNCTFKCGDKSVLKQHLKTVHKKVDQNLIESLIEKLRKLKPDFQNIRYV